MLYKFRFKNHSCFYHWQEVDLINVRTINVHVEAVKKGAIFGNISSGKTAIIELLETTINYIKHFLTYTNISSSLFSVMSDKYNPFLFIESQVINNPKFSVENKTINESIEKENKFDHKKNLLKGMNKNLSELYLYDKYEPTDVELYLCDASFLYKYQLSYTNNYPQFEALSYKLNDDNHESKDWIELYSKTKKEYSYVDGKEKCIFETKFNIKELDLPSEPSIKNINQKNSMILFLKQISNSTIIKSFSQIINSFNFINEITYKNSINNFKTNKEYFIKNKDIFLSIFKELQLNIVDYSIADDVHRKNFAFMIGKVDENNNIIYINSKFESDNVIKLFHIIYHGLKGIDSKQIIVIDNLDKNIDIKQISYLFNLIHKSKNSINKEEQFIFALNNIHLDDVLGISDANNEITTGYLISNITRVY